MEEQVSLSKERAKVERRPVDRPATQAESDAFNDQSFEVHETEEVPVISKQARVTEEVSIGKEAEVHTEKVQETVRRTDVKVEQTGQAQGQRWSGSASEDADFEKHFVDTPHDTRENFDAYRSAYHYAEASSNDPQLQGKDWPEAEEVLHRNWERSHPGTWSKFREAIHYGWDKTHHRR